MLQRKKTNELSVGSARHMVQTLPLDVSRSSQPILIVSMSNQRNMSAEWEQAVASMVDAEWDASIVPAITEYIKVAQRFYVCSRVLCFEASCQ